jgi:hypothetical protein
MLLSHRFADLWHLPLKIICTKLPWALPVVYQHRYDAA